MAEITTAEIIAVGSELLTSHRIDTNSLFLTGRLNELGIGVRAKAVVGDHRDSLASVLRAALSRAEVIITTGGLGPTDDDLTRVVVADVLGRELTEDPTIVSAISERFKARGWRMPDINRRQAMVPAGADVLRNANGTAPGLVLEADGRLIVLLPGPPRELQPMFDEQVAPRLAARAPERRLRRRVLKITGRSESQVEEVAFPIYSALSDDAVTVETTILATPGQIELHLSAAGTNVVGMDARLEAGVSRLAAALGDCVFSTDDRGIEEIVGHLLRERRWTIAVAESCTGGLTTARLTDVSGSSGWVVGGIVAYANRVKERELGVPAATIDTHGAVSEPVAVAMAEGVAARLGADVGIGITGIAGPDGGTPQKPVGTVVIAVTAAALGTTVKTLTFPGNRDAVRKHATSNALDMVRRLIAGR